MKKPNFLKCWDVYCQASFSQIKFSFQVQLSSQEQIEVTKEDKIGWKYDDNLGFISFDYKQGHRVRSRRYGKNNINPPLGINETGSFDPLYLPAEFSIGVRLGQDSKIKNNTILDREYNDSDKFIAKTCKFIKTQLCKKMTKGTILWATEQVLVLLLLYKMSNSTTKGFLQKYTCSC